MTLTQKKILTGALAAFGALMFISGFVMDRSTFAYDESTVANVIEVADPDSDSCTARMQYDAEGKRYSKWFSCSAIPNRYVAINTEATIYYASSSPGEATLQQNFAKTSKSYRRMGFGLAFALAGFGLYRKVTVKEANRERKA